MKRRYRVVENTRPIGIVVSIGILAGALIIAVWPPGRPADPPNYRRLCELQGGIMVRTEGGPLCFWAGAIIPTRAE